MLPGLELIALPQPQQLHWPLLTALPVKRIRYSQDAGAVGRTASITPQTVSDGRVLEALCQGSPFIGGEGCLANPIDVKPAARAYDRARWGQPDRVIKRFQRGRRLSSGRVALGRVLNVNVQPDGLERDGVVLGPMRNDLPELVQLVSSLPGEAKINVPHSG